MKQLSLLLLSIATVSLMACGNGISMKKQTFDFTTYESSLTSPDWHVRYQAVKELGSLSHHAFPLLEKALADRSDVVSRVAQEMFVRHGLDSVPYLSKRLTEVKEDRGMGAMAVGGVETNRGKSLAFTLKLVLVRGLPWDEAHRQCQLLAQSHNARLKAVALYASSFGMTSRFLTIIESLKDDGDELVKKKFQESLLRILCHKQVLFDKSLEAKALELLKPHWVSLANRPEAGFYTMGNEHLVEMVKKCTTPEHSENLMQAIIASLSDSSLTERGACSLGSVLDHQRLPEKLSVALKPIFEPGSTMAPNNKVALLSSLDPTVLSSLPITDLFELAKTQNSPYSPRLTVSLGSLKDHETTAVKQVKTWLQGDQDTLCLQSAIESLRLLDSLKENKMEELGKDLRKTLYEQSDRLFKLSESSNSVDLTGLIHLFHRLEDDRAINLYSRIWKFRTSDKVWDQRQIIKASRPFMQEGNKAIIPYFLEHLKSGPDIKHSNLKDFIIYRLVGKPFGEHIEEFLTKEEFDRWIKIFSDPKENPRFRAGFASLLSNPKLDAAKKTDLQNTALTFTSYPHDRNLRSKCIWGLGDSGDQRVYPIIWKSMLDPEHQGWCYYNFFYALAGLEGLNLDDPAKKGDVKLQKKAAKPVVLALETLVRQSSKYEQGREPLVLHDGNYHEWNNQFRADSVNYAVMTLKDITGQDFGRDAKKWQEWISMEERKTEAVNKSGP